MQYPVGEAEEDQGERGAKGVRALQTTHGRRQLAIELRLLLQEPAAGLLQKAGRTAKLHCTLADPGSLLGTQGGLAWLGLLRLRRQHQARHHQGNNSQCAQDRH